MSLAAPPAPASTNIHAYMSDFIEEVLTQTEHDDLNEAGKAVPAGLRFKGHLLTHQWIELCASWTADQ